MAGVVANVREFGIPQRFIDQGTRAGILAELGVTAQQIARFATEAVLAGETEPSIGAVETGYPSSTPLDAASATVPSLRWSRSRQRVGMEGTSPISCSNPRSDGFPSSGERSRQRRPRA